MPAFPDGGPVIVVDGECSLCSVSARLIARFDRVEEFRICRSQGPLGSALLRHYGFEPDDPDSWLYIVDGQVFTSLDGIIRVGARVGGPGWLLQPLRLLPRSLQDGLYRCIARNRHRLFGRNDLCSIPDAGLRARLLE